MCCGSRRARIIDRTRAPRRQQAVTATAPVQQEMAVPILQRTSEGVFQVWVSRAYVTYNFAKFIENFLLKPPFVIVHFDTEWGVYDGLTDEYFKAEGGNIHATIPPKMLEMDSRIYNSKPNGVLVFENAVVQIDGGVGHLEFTIEPNTES